MPEGFFSPGESMMWWAGVGVCGWQGGGGNFGMVVGGRGDSCSRHSANACGVHGEPMQILLLDATMAMVCRRERGVDVRFCTSRSAVVAGVSINYQNLVLFSTPHFLIRVRLDPEAKKEL